MPTLNGRQYTGVKGLNLRSDNAVIRFETPAVNPTTTSGERLLYVNSSNELVYDSGSGTTVLGAGGGGSTPSWETIFGADATMTITADTTFTIAGNRSTATDVLTITNIAGGSGDCIQITNSGSGNDIQGTSNTWKVTAAGVATFAGVSISGTSSALATTGAAVWTVKDNDSAALTISASGATGLIAIDSTDNAELVKFGKSIQVTDGKATFISTSNTVSNVLVTNNTATTFGADADSSGVVVFRSTSLTTGSLLQLQLTEGTLNGGFYLTCRDVTAGANVFTLGEDGAQVIAGAGGSDMFTVTAGDVVISDGSITMTDADNAATLSITNNTATTASVFAFAGSGVFTGNTTSSFMKITASGLTTGTVLYMPAAALTTGKMVDMVANALTTGNILNVSATGATDGVLFNVTGGGANMTATGKIMTLAMGAATVGNGIALSTTGVYTGTGLITLTANSATTGVVQQITANGLTTGNALNVSSSGTVTSSGSGIVAITGSGVTTGYICQITDGGASNTMTSGNVLRLYTNSSDTTARGVLSIIQDHASASGATAILIQQDGVVSTNYRRLIKESATGITIWMGNGTTANGNLSGTAGDLLINGGSNKPEYCTGTTNWTALV